MTHGYACPPPSEPTTPCVPLCFAGVVVAFVGVVIMHDLRQQPWVNWLLPMVLLLGLLVVVGTVLEAFKYKVKDVTKDLVSVDLQAS